MKEILGISESNFIVGGSLVQKEDKKLYRVEFANRRSLLVERTPENVMKIDKHLKEQAERGQNFYCSLVRERKRGIIAGTAVGIGSSAFVGAGIYERTGDLYSAACASGVIVLVEFAVLLRSYHNMQAMGSFLKFITERTDAQEEVDAFLHQTPNILSIVDGVTSRGRERRAIELLELMKEEISLASAFTGLTGEGLTEAEFGRAKAEAERQKRLGLTLATPSSFQLYNTGQQ